MKQSFWGEQTAGNASLESGWPILRGMLRAQLTFGALLAQALVVSYNECIRITWLAKTQTEGPYPQECHSAGVRWSLIICISDNPQIMLTWLIQGPGLRIIVLPEGWTHLIKF